MSHRNSRRPEWSKTKGRSPISNEHEIKSEKILVKDIFSTMWFRIPSYQRPYFWGKDKISESLGDLTSLINFNRTAPIYAT